MRFSNSILVKNIIIASLIFCVSCSGNADENTKSQTNQSSSNTTNQPTKSPSIEPPQGQAQPQAGTNIFLVEDPALKGPPRPVSAESTPLLRHRHDPSRAGVHSGSLLRTPGQSAYAFPHSANVLG